MLIRRLTYFDYPKLKRLVSYLGSDASDRLAKSILDAPMSILNAMCPLVFKFQSESFILVDNNEILGLITTLVTPGNFSKINITRLIFKENMYDVGKQLVHFVVNKFGGKGATSFNVTIDECHEELFDLFINGCGFRQCASETLWKSEKPVPVVQSRSWRYAQNSDAKAIVDLYNSELISIYKPSMLRNEKEFQELFFSGLQEGYKIRYLIEEDNILKSYFSIYTTDNLNYILDITSNSGYDVDYDKIINIMLCDIAKKKQAFFPIVKLKKYVKKAEVFEEYLKEHKYYPIQTKQILVKDFFKPIVEKNQGLQVFVFGENQITTN